MSRKVHPRVVNQLDETAIIADQAGVMAVEVTRGGVPVALALAIFPEGRFNKQRRRARPGPIVLDRDDFIELVTQAAHAGAAADREFASELHSAVEIGLERYRLEGLKAS